MASVYWTMDAAAVCTPFDAVVHATNLLASRHERASNREGGTRSRRGGGVGEWSARATSARCAQSPPRRLPDWSRGQAHHLPAGPPLRHPSWQPAGKRTTTSVVVREVVVGTVVVVGKAAAQGSARIQRGGGEGALGREEGGRREGRGLARSVAPSRIWALGTSPDLSPVSHLGAGRIDGFSASPDPRRTRSGGPLAGRSCAGDGGRR
jgi:hypothetical protein